MSGSFCLHMSESVFPLLSPLNNELGAAVLPGHSYSSLAL